MLTETLTYLQMTDPGHLRPAAVVDDLELRPADPASPLVRMTQEAVARRHHWARLGWSDAEWWRWLADPAHHHSLIVLSRSVVGVLELVVEGDEVEISAFGLLPERVGQRLGGYALTLAVRQAWQAAGTADLRRVWLYTSDLDHPHALHNYRARGFTPYRRAIRHRDDLSDSAMPKPVRARVGDD